MSNRNEIYFKIDNIKAMKLYTHFLIIKYKNVQDKKLINTYH